MHLKPNLALLEHLLSYLPATHSLMIRHCMKDGFLHDKPITHTLTRGASRNEAL